MATQQTLNLPFWVQVPVLVPRPLAQLAAQHAYTVKVQGSSPWGPTNRRLIMARNKEKYNAYMKEYMRKWHQNRKEEAIIQLGGECVICKSTEDLEFDHIDPSTKKYTIARIYTHSEEKFQTELAKCQLLCHEHHQEKHASQAPCGTDARYSAGCRCVDCKNAHSIYMKEWKAKQYN